MLMPVQITQTSKVSTFDIYENHFMGAKGWYELFRVSIFLLLLLLLLSLLLLFLLFLSKKGFFLSHIYINRLFRPLKSDVFVDLYFHQIFTLTEAANFFLLF